MPRELETSVVNNLEIRSLLGSNDGSLWIGTTRGIFRLKNGRLSTYPQVKDYIFSMVQDPDGSIWLARSGYNSAEYFKPLCHVTGQGARCFGEADGLYAGGAESLALSRDGALWLGTDVSLIRWKDGLKQEWHPADLRLNTGADGVHGLAIDSDGSIILAKVPSQGGSSLDRIVNGVETPIHLPGVKLTAVLRAYIDSHGVLWLTTPDKGLIRVWNGNVDQFGNAEGLSSNYPSQVLEDREGSLWVITSKGLDCLYETKIISFSKNQNLSMDNVNSVLATRSGQVLVGTSANLQVLTPTKSFKLSAPLRGAAPLFQDTDGNIWLGDDGLRKNSKGHEQSILDKNGKRLGLVYGVTQDPAGDIFAQVVGNTPGIYRIRGLRVEDVISPDQIPKVRVITNDRQSLWIGLRDGNIAQYADHRLQTFYFTNDIDANIYRIIADDQLGILAASSYGLIGIKNGVPWSFGTTNGLPCQLIYSVIVDFSSNIWLSGSCGLLEIRAEGLGEWIRHREAKIPVRQFDTADGMQAGRAPFNSFTRSPDGRLWLANGSILQMIDPAHLHQNEVRPPVQIEDLIVDHEPYKFEGTVRLPPLTREIQIDFTALSFIAPKKVRFKYRLIGHDADWTDAEARRQAFYNDLSPGRYTFRVIASNNDGLWNDTGATLLFSVAPAWYQQIWFRSLLLLIATLSLWILYQQRMQRVTADARLRAMSQAEERVRVARELHDTLLQGIQGLVLSLRVLLRQIPEGSEAEKGLERALAIGDQVLVEGRDKVIDLRSEKESDKDLKQALENFAADLAIEQAATLSIKQTGRKRLLRGSVSDEVLAIGREALGNAYKHSGATEIFVEITYKDVDFRMVCSDNGRGFVESYKASAEESRHWGIRGMRERAAIIGAAFVCVSSKEKGTRIEIVLPARKAYIDHSSLLGRLLPGFLRRR